MIISKTGLLTLFFWGIAVALVIVMTYIPANCDIGWLTYATSSWLAGDALYRDIFEVNPPLIFYLMSPGVWLANFIGAEPILIYKASVGVFALGILAWSGHLLKALIGFNQHISNVIFAFAGLVYALVLPGNADIYAQREHLFILAILPYLIVSIPSPKPSYTKTTHIMTALIAALGLCLKPHFFLIWLAVESFHWFARTGIIHRIAYLVIIPFCACAYAVLVVIFHPEYFTELAPIAAQSYGAHRFSAEHVWLRLLVAIAPLAFILITTAGACSKKNITTHYFFAAVFLASCLITLSQFKGWNYTYLPPKAISVLYLAWVAAENRRYLSRKMTKNEPFWFLLYLVCVASLLWLLLFEPYNEWRFLLSPFVVFIVLLFGLRLHYALNLAKSNAGKAMFSAAITLIAILAIAYPILRAASYFWFLLPWWWGTLLLFMLVIMILHYRAASRHHKLRLLYNPSMRIWAAITIMMVTCYGYYISYRASQDVYTSKLMTTLVEEVKKYPDAKNIYLFNIGIYPAFPLNNLVKKDWSGRFHQLWMIPAAYSAPEQCTFNAKGEAIMAWTIKYMLEDFKRQPPDLVFIDESPSHIFRTQERFDFKQCLSHFPEFADWLASYKQVNFLDLCAVSKTYECRFSIWRRRED